MYHLIEKLCEIHAPSGNESAMTQFVLDHVRDNSKQWKTQPEIYAGTDFQDCIILKFGNSRTALFSHMDSTGFTVRYANQLVPIGGPEVETGFSLVGQDSLGFIECSLELNEEGYLFYDFGRGIDRGTTLTFKPNFRSTSKYIQSPYLDNRLGVTVALELCKTLTDGIVVFSCWEEHGGGSIPFLIKFLFERWQINQALICDITWVTEGVQPGEGAAISLRDRNIPRTSFLKRILNIANKSAIPFQLEVESGGSSDGREIQQSPYPIDWCFVGAPELHVHSPNELVHKKDIESMLALYQCLMQAL